MFTSNTSCSQQELHCPRLLSCATMNVNTTKIIRATRIMCPTTRFTGWRARHATTSRLSEMQSLSPILGLLEQMNFNNSLCTTKQKPLQIKKAQSGGAYLLSHIPEDALPSALEYFTSLFGMGRGGTTPV